MTEVQKKKIPTLIKDSPHLEAILAASI
jgi:hypothetical protein